MKILEFLGLLVCICFLGVRGYFCLRNSRILCDEIIWLSLGMTQGLGILEFLAIKTRIPKTKNTPNFSGVLGAAAPKGLGRSPYEICELDLSSLKASKNLEFLE